MAKITEKKEKFFGHEFKKSLGQNFISDTNLLKSLVNDSCITSEDVCLEIGAGAGTLTKQLCLVAKKVVSVEIDKSLSPILDEIEKSNPNLKIVYNDILKLSEDEIVNLFGEGKDVRFKVVANIPYYITSPILFKFLKMPNVTSLSLLMQKEVAERIVAKKSDSDYGALSVMVNYLSEPVITRIVGRNNFYPVPNVDSAFLKATKKEDVTTVEAQEIERLVKAAFSCRRKMLTNNLSSEYNLSKPEIAEILEKTNLKPTARAEELTVKDYVQLNKELAKYKSTKPAK